MKSMRENREREFPALERLAYLNTAAEGLPPRAVGEALRAYAADKAKGMAGREDHFAELERLQASAARMYGLKPSEVAMCSSSSEAYNLTALALDWQSDDEVIINDLDFPAGATPWLQPTHPATVKLWRSREGVLHVEDLARILSARTRLVTVSAVSFFNGFRVPLPALVETVHRHAPALVAVDVTQALGRVPLDLTGVDLIVSSTHKWILGSHGGGLVGIPEASAERLHVRAGGWHNLEDPFGPDRFASAPTKAGAAGYAVGMPNFPAVYAVRAALDFIEQIGVERIHREAQPLVRACYDELAKLPVRLITPADDASLAGIISFQHPDADRIQEHLLQRDVHIMCQAGRMRVAIHGYNTPEDVERLLRALKEALHGVAAG